MCDKCKEYQRLLEFSSETQKQLAHVLLRRSEYAFFEYISALLTEDGAKISAAVNEWADIAGNIEAYFNAITD